MRFLGSQALRQGRWREAENPRAYLRTVALREGRKARVAAEMRDELVLMPTSSESEGLSSENTLDHIAYIGETSEAIRGSGGVWRRGGGWVQQRDEWYEGTPTSRLLAKVPASLKRLVEPPPELVELVEAINASSEDEHIHLAPAITIDLDRWAEQAGFDAWERKVLEYRSNDISRDRALAEQPDEDARRALQAALRRFDRTGKRRLREAAEKNLEKTVPDDADYDTY